MRNDGLAPGERYFEEIRTVTFRKEEFQYLHTGIVDENGESWTTTELDEANVFQVYNQYRMRHGIPFPDEIIGLRRHYGLSAAKMSQILGFGINQYRMYEEGEVPSISNARTIIAAREKSVFMQFVEASRAELSQTEYARVIKKLSTVEGDFKLAGVPSEYTGFRSLSYCKIAAVVNGMLKAIGATFVTKMNKLLFYVDFIHYKRHGYGITGLTYRALQFGPVPEDWAKVYSNLPGIMMEEYVYPGGQSGVRLVSVAGENENPLSPSENSAVDYVCGLFRDVNAAAISEISHREKAWKDNESTHSIISYQLAFEIDAGHR